jgi:hypothetical protein
MQHLGDAVVRKHGDLVDIVKLAVSLAVKSGPKVGDEDLRALQKPDFLAFKLGLVPEAGEPLGEQVDQPSSRVLCIFDQDTDAAVEFLEC